MAELDVATIGELRSKWSGRTFDAVYDQPTTVWDAIKTSVQMQHAAPITRGATISIIEDKAQIAANAALGVDQIASLTLTYAFSSVGDYDGVEGEYRNGLDNAVLYATWPEDAVNPEKVVLWGCKSPDNALNFVKRFWKQTTKRRKMVSFDTELDGRNFYLGQAVDISHPILSETNAVMVIVSSIKPVDDVKTTVEAYVYEHEVFL